LRVFAGNEARKKPKRLCKAKNREKSLNLWRSELRGHWNDRGAATEVKSQVLPVSCFLPEKLLGEVAKKKFPQSQEISGFAGICRKCSAEKPEWL